MFVLFFRIVFFRNFVQVFRVVCSADIRTGSAHFGFAEVNGENVAVNFHNTAEQTAGCDDIVAFFEGAEHFSVLFCAFLLRTDQQKVEYDKHQDKRYK